MGNAKEITKERLYECLEKKLKLRTDKKIFSKIFKEMDKNDNCSIDFNEFCDFMELENAF